MFPSRISNARRFGRRASKAFGFVSILLPLLACAHANAATIYVSPSGDDGNPGTPASPFLTIKAAIDTAVDGDTVTLEDGTYSGAGNYNVDTGRKTITITSQNGAANTIIDCQYLGPGLILQSAGEVGDAPTKLINITIEHAALEPGYGAVYALGPNVEVDGCVLKDNDADALDCWRSTLVRVNNCIFQGNSYTAVVADFGSGVIIESSEFTKNREGAIFNLQGSVGISNSSFTENLLTGAIDCTSFGLIVASDCVFSKNVSNIGGAIDGEGYSSIELARCTFTGNVSTYRAGAIDYAGTDLLLQQCKFIDNSSAGLGGAVYSAGTSTFDSCLFSGNSSAADGGAIYNETSFYEIGVESNAKITNCAFLNNIAEGGVGGGIANNGTALVEDSTFNRNRALTAGGAISGPSTTLVNDILWDDFAPMVPEVDAAASATYSDIASMHPGIGNIRRDPQFVNPAVGELHLKPTSPCIGTGINLSDISFDIEGNSKPEFSGMGAYDSINTVPATITSFEPLSGPVGTLVTIHGSYLSGALAVKFNGIATTSFKVVSPSEITVVVPQYASNGQISIKKQYSTATSAGVFTVPDVAPTITGFAASAGPVGSHVHIAGSNFKNSSTVAFNGVPASYQFISSASIDAIVPAGATAGLISVAALAGTAYSKTKFTVTMK